MTSQFRLWIITAAWVLSAVAAVVGISFSDRSVALGLSPAAAVFIGGGALFAYCLATGERWALATLLLLAVVVFSCNFRDTAAGVAATGGFDAVSAAKLLIYLFALAGGFLLLPYTYGTFTRMPGILLVILMAWASVTMPFSLSPLYSAAMVFGMVAWMVYSAALCQLLKPREIMVMMMIGLSVFLIGSVIAYFVFPTYGRFLTLGTVRLKGLSATPNEAAQLAGYFVIAGVAYVLQGGGVLSNSLLGRFWLSISALMALVVLALAQTRGAIAGILCALVVMTAQRLRLSWMMVAVLLTGISIGFAWYSAEPNAFGFLKGQEAKFARGVGGTEDVESFAGRTAIWQFVVEKIHDRPLTGYGYGAGANVIVEGYSTPWGQTTSSAHDAFLQAGLDLGVPGMGILIAIFVWSAVSALRKPSPFRDGMFVMLLFTCLLESAVSKPANIASLIWLIALFVQPETDAAETLSPENEADLPPAA